MNTPTKICRDCGGEFTYDQLVDATINSKGPHALCKACKNAKERERYARHIDAARQKNREKRKRLRALDPQGDIEQTREWRKAHPEQYKESKRKSDHGYYVRNQEHIKARVLEYTRDNPDSIRARNARRRAAKKNAEGRYTAKDVKRQYRAQDGKCWWCSKLIVGEVHADHVIPLSRGGTNWPDNIRCTCQRCNNSKKDKLPYVEWIPPNPLEPPIHRHGRQLTLL